MGDFTLFEEWISKSKSLYMLLAYIYEKQIYVWDILALWDVETLLKFIRNFQHIVVML